MDGDFPSLSEHVVGVLLHEYFCVNYYIRCRSRKDSACFDYCLGVSAAARWFGIGRYNIVTHHVGYNPKDFLE